MVLDRINYLKNEINKHNYNYYVEDNPTISDFEYDKLFAELKELEAQNPLFPIICVSQSYHHALSLNVGVPLGISPLEVDPGPVQEDERAVGKGLIHELLVLPVSRLNDLLNGRFRDRTARLSRQDLADLRIGHAPVIQS